VSNSCLQLLPHYVAEAAGVTSGAELAVILCTMSNVQSGGILMRLFALLFSFLVAFPALAFSPEPLHPSADRMAARIAAMPAFDGQGMVERKVKGLPGYRHIIIQGADGKLSASLLIRGSDLIGVRFDIPLLPKADPGLYAFIDIARELEPEMKGLKLNTELSRRDALKGWASEIGIESWMRPRFGAYRMERRVGRSLFVFEGAPLQGFWIGMSAAGNRHPVLDHLSPWLTKAESEQARPVLTAVERGEYELARKLAQPYVDQGLSWAMLVMADYGEPVGPGRAISTEINRLLEAAAEKDYAPAHHVLGQADSSYAERHLKRAAAAGYAPAIAIATRRLHSGKQANDPAARCEELVALQGDAMAQLRTVYRYAEGGGEPETAYFWGRVTLETFGEASSITIDSYILHTLGVLADDLTEDQQIQQEKRAAAFVPKPFKELEPHYKELGCFG
jgi:hypothetical protein